MRFLRTTMIMGGALASALVGTAAHAQCGGICLYEVGTPQMGSSYAGMAATAQDASTAFLNPAGMTRLDKAEYLQGLFAADVQLEFDNRSSVAPFGGNDGGNAAGFVPGGGGYLVLPIADQLPFAEDFEYMKDLRFGLALNGLFGGTVDYSSSWLGRTFVTEADLQILNIQPGFGWRVTDWLSVGASLNVYRVELSKYRLRATPLPGAPTLKADGASDWDTAFTVGILLEPREGTRIGAMYRYKADLSLTGGDASGFQYDFDLPQGFNLSLFEQITPRLALLADVGWTDWSQFSQQQIVVSTPLGTADTSFSRRWKDTWRFGGGFQYQLTETWLLLGGVSYDTSPVKDSRRTPDLPVSEQWRFSTGIQYALGENMKLGLSYTLLWFGNPEIDSVTLPGAFPVTLDGKYDPAYGQFVGLTFQWSFCSPLPWASCPAGS